MNIKHQKNETKRKMPRTTCNNYACHSNNWQRQEMEEEEEEKPTRERRTLLFEFDSYGTNLNGIMCAAEDPATKRSKRRSSKTCSKEHKSLSKRAGYELKSTLKQHSSPASHHSLWI